MAKKKAPAKTTVKAPATPLWMWMEKGDGEAYGQFKTRDLAVADAKQNIEYNHNYHNDKNIVIQVFQQVEELKLTIKLEEIPVTSFKTKVTVV